jgi:hypothetical protein
MYRAIPVLYIPQAQNSRPGSADVRSAELKFKSASQSPLVGKRKPNEYQASGLVGAQWFFVTHKIMSRSVAETELEPGERQHFVTAGAVKSLVPVYRMTLVSRSRSRKEKHHFSGARAVTLPLLNFSMPTNSANRWI